MHLIQITRKIERLSVFDSISTVQQQTTTDNNRQQQTTTDNNRQQQQQQQCSPHQA